MPEICNKFIADVASYADGNMRHSVILGSSIVMGHILNAMAQDISPEAFVEELKAMSKFINEQQEICRLKYMAIIPQEMTETIQ